MTKRLRKRKRIEADPARRDRHTLMAVMDQLCAGVSRDWRMPPEVLAAYYAFGSNPAPASSRKK